VIVINGLLIPDEIDHPGVFCHPDAFVIPTFFVIPTLLSSRRRRDLRAMQKQFQATNLYSLIYFIRIAFAPVIRIALRQPLRCFVPQHDKTDAFVIPTFFVIPTLLSSRRRRVTTNNKGQEPVKRQKV